MRSVVTGATGFIGRRLVEALRERGVRVVALTRDTRTVQRLWPDGSVTGFRADLAAGDDLREACRGVDTVFHLAGHAHATDQDSPQAERLHQQTTVDGTRALLAAAVAAGVRWFVFLSSVKAMGEGGEDCLAESATAKPETFYGRAKLEAERLVLAAGRDHGMHVAVLRLPLVYGTGNKGNIPRMIAGIDRGRFPPLPRVQNKRSMVHVDDVVQALLLAVENPVANGQVFIVTDARTYSTREMYEAICQALGRPVPVWTVPGWMFRFAASVGDALQRMTGRPMPVTTSTLDKLFGSAWYSSAKIRRELGFVPRHTFHDALPEIVAEYRRSMSRVRREA